MKMLLLGDICPTDITKELFAKEDAETLFSDTVSLFEGKDAAIANLECAITDSDRSILKFGPALSAPVNTANLLKKIGIDYIGISNNHIFDFGIKGATDSIAYLEQAGIKHTGFGSNYEDARKNLVIEQNGEKICVIAVCEREYSYALEDRMGSRPFDEFDTMEDIEAAKREYDRVIVLYHGGKEYCRYPSPRLLKTCRAMAKHGADLVLCQHSHCIGCYEYYNDCHILYGQGNFHFIEEKSTVPECWNSLLAVDYDTRSNEIAFTPIVNTELGITLAKDTEKAEILQSFASRNQELQSGAWRQQWHSFCESVKANYVSAVQNACNEDSTPRLNHRFAHYLDCQAHTDVWRELFPTYNQTNEKQV